MSDNIKEILTGFMRPNETLDPFLFDYREQMKEEIQTKLLSCAQRIIEHVFAPIKGLEIADICLTGSTSSYFYHQKSDIDMRIEIHNKNCPYLTKDPNLFDSFLNTMSNTFYRTGNIELVNNRFVDIKTSSRQIDLLGLYSIKKQKWRIYPNKNIYRNINPDEIIDLYFKRKEKIKTDMAKIRSSSDGLELAENINKYYINQIVSNTNIKDFLVYKLLKHDQVFQIMSSLNIRLYNKALSLEEE